MVLPEKFPIIDRAFEKRRALISAAKPLEDRKEQLDVKTKSKIAINWLLLRSTSKVVFTHVTACEISSLVSNGAGVHIHCRGKLRTKKAQQDLRWCMWARSWLACAHSTLFLSNNKSGLVSSGEENKMKCHLLLFRRMCLC
jgi:hypothetical protein